MLESIVKQMAHNTMTTIKNPCSCMSCNACAIYLAACGIHSPPPVQRVVELPPEPEPVVVRVQNLFSECE